MRNKYYLTILGVTSVWRETIIAIGYALDNGTYTFYDTDNDDKRIVVASYPIARTIIETIEHDVQY